MQAGHRGLGNPGGGVQAGHRPGRMKTSTDGSMLPQSQHRAEGGAGARPVLPDLGMACREAGRPTCPGRGLLGGWQSPGEEGLHGWASRGLRTRRMATPADTCRSAAPFWPPGDPLHLTHPYALRGWGWGRGTWSLELQTETEQTPSPKGAASPPWHPVQRGSRKMRRGWHKMELHAGGPGAWETDRQ